MIVEELASACCDDESVDLVTDSRELRRVIGEHLLTNAKNFRVKIDSSSNKVFRSLLNPGRVPCDEMLLAAADYLGMPIYVYHGMRYPVVYQPEEVRRDSVIHIQCILNIMIY